VPLVVFGGSGHSEVGGGIEGLATLVSALILFEVMVGQSAQPAADEALHPVLSVPRLRISIAWRTGLASIGRAVTRQACCRSCSMSYGVKCPGSVPARSPSTSRIN
jgi:hypothetical protein